MQRFLIVFLFALLSVGGLCETLRVERPLKGRIQAMGVEFDPHFLSQNVRAGNGAKAEDWDNVVVRRLRLLGVEKLRVMVLPFWYEAENDNADPDVTDWSRLSFDNPEMDNLYRMLDVAEHDGLQVTLTFWGARPGTFMLPETGPYWVIGPENNEEFCENVSACLHHLLLDKGYTCIKEVTPVNEPDWSYMGDRASHLPKYVALCRVLDARLRRDGLRSLVRLNLSDDSDGNCGRHDFLHGCTAELGKMADLYNSHNYIFSYGTPNSAITDWERHNAQLAESVGRQHFIGEFGNPEANVVHDLNDMDSYRRGVLLARIVVCMLNGGACGLSYWNLQDQHYGLDDARRGGIPSQQFGLWRYLKKVYVSDSAAYARCRCDYDVRPSYHAMGLLYHAVRSGQQVYPLTTVCEWLAGIALRDRSGRWTYILVNQSGQAQPVTILNRKHGKTTSFSLSAYEEARLPEDDRMITPHAAVQSRDGHIDLIVADNTFVVLSQKP